MTNKTDSAKADKPDHPGVRHAARVVAWLVTVLLVGLAVAMFAGALPEDRLLEWGATYEHLRVASIGLTILAVLANTLAFRPPRGSSQAGGPQPRYQGERLAHVLVTVLPLVAILKSMGLF